jgi:hypothetical protein
LEGAGGQGAARRDTGGAAPSDEDPDHRRWYDDEAGPLVRLYALTRGRTRPRHEVFDLIALITARPDRAQYRHDPSLGPEHAAVLELSSHGGRSVVDLAADCDLPIGITRVILSDLLEVGLIQVSRPPVPQRLPDERMLREVINGLRAL